MAATNSAEDFEDIAKQFVEHYYNTFDNNRQGLGDLYREQSMLTFESASVLGAPSIVEKLVSLPFQKVIHKIETIDAQPGSGNGGVLILVTGALMVDAEERPMRYTQTFQLALTEGHYWVQNDIFKLIY